jgi:SAM-dependent methyltransferase
MAEDSVTSRATLSSFWHWLDRRFGRGSYYWLRDHIDPQREYTQITYGRLVDDLLTPNTRWLDAGGGHMVLETTGADQEEAMVRKVALVACCDLEFASLARHRSIKHRVCATLDSLPFGERKFDLVTLNSVAEHLEHPVKVLSEFARVLAPDGRVVIHTTNVSSYGARLVTFGRRILPESFVMALIRFMDFREEEDVFPTYYRINTARSMSEAAACAGFSCEQVLLLPARPLFYFIGPLSAIELAASRLLMSMGAQNFAASVIVGVYRKLS